MKLGAALYRLQQQWLTGFAVLLIVVASAAAFAVGAALLIVAAGLLFGWDWESSLDEALLVSALVWLPVSAGMVASSLRRFAAVDKAP